MFFSCAILAGGQSRRFGSDKTLAKINGLSFTEILVRKFLRVSDDVIVISKNSDKFDFYFEGVTFVNDLYEQQCPLVGIITALHYSKNDWIFVSSADTPFVDLKLLDLLVEKLKGYDVVLPVINGKIHTLCGFYNKQIVQNLIGFLNKGVLRLLDIYPFLKVNFYDIEDEVRKFDPELISFLNVNTKEDYYTALKVVKESNRKIV